MYIRESIESILSQTFSDFEFLIVDNGSIYNSVEIIKAYKDLRITLICNTTNLGTSAALNKAIANASGTYIAIMHCDDISLPNRLEHQVLFMEKIHILVYAAVLFRYLVNEIKCGVMKLIQRILNVSFYFARPLFIQ